MPGSLHTRFVRRFGHPASRMVPIFLAIALLSLSSTLLVYWMDLKVAWANQAAQRSQEVIAGLEDLLSSLKDAETGQRGFVLTGDEKYLQPYDAAVQHVGSQLDQLKDWARTGQVASGESTTACRHPPESARPTKGSLKPLCPNTLAW